MMPAAAKFKSGLARQLKNSKRPVAPLWEGPCGEGPQGGVTQGLLARYFVCPERFRVHVIEGLRAPERFSAPLDFGSMWHACEESFAKHGDNKVNAAGADVGASWEGKLRMCARDLCAKYPLQQEEIAGWHDKCRAMFPLYVKHWSEHPDVRDRVPLFQEQTFDVPYPLPSGRVVRLRGKWDAVDLIGKGKGAGVYLQENKSKSSIDSQKIAQQLGFDLQTMVYVIALLCKVNGDEEWLDEHPALAPFKGGVPVRGVRYNVVRRSAHKSVESMLEKIAKDEKEGRIGEWFARWKVNVLPADVERFKRCCLDPVLENLCDDHEWWKYCSKQVATDEGWDRFDCTHRVIMFPAHVRRHFITPFGIHNTIAEGGSTDLDEHIRTGSTVGLVRVDDLFPELK